MPSPATWTVNPIQAATLRTGKSALILLALSLACSPLSSIFGWKQLIKVRRPLGLYAALYGLVHFYIFIGVDYAFNLGFIWADASTKPYIWVGLAAGTILLALAVTSFRWWMRKLGKNWKRLHKLVYLAAPLIILHFAWVRKGNLATLSGDLIQPLLFGLGIALLLITRIPAVRKTLMGWASGLRAAFRTRRSATESG